MLLTACVGVPYFEGPVVCYCCMLEMCKNDLYAGKFKLRKAVPPW